MKPLITVLLFSTLTLVLFYGQCNCQHATDRLVGGLFEERPANAEVSEIVTNAQIPIKQAIRSKMVGSEQRGTLTPVSYRTQLVNGINYFIKVRTLVGTKKVYYNVRIHKDFDGTVTFNRVEGPIRRNAGLTYF